MSRAVYLSANPNEIFRRWFVDRYIDTRRYRCCDRIIITDSAPSVPTIAILGGVNGLRAANNSNWILQTLYTYHASLQGKDINYRYLATRPNEFGSGELCKIALARARADVISGALSLLSPTNVRRCVAFCVGVEDSQGAINMLLKLP